MDPLPEKHRTCFEHLLAWVSSMLAEDPTPTSRSPPVPNAAIHALELEVQRKEEAAVLFLKDLK